MESVIRLQFIHICLFVQFYLENCFNHLLQKDLVFFYARADSKCKYESFHFSQILYFFIKKKSEILPTIKKNPTLIRDNTKQLNVFNVSISFKVQGIG